MNTHILLIQLGTPSSPTTASVKKYLKQFLSDPRVLNIPAIFRFFLLRCVILPLRSPKSAKAYQKIWTKKGSPLFHYTQSLAKKLQVQFNSKAKVHYAMRYGNPSIPSLIEKIIQQKAHKIILVPLYPQYASCTTGSALEEVYKALKNKWNQPAIQVIPPFYNHPNFIDALTHSIKSYTQKKNWDKIIYSFHGLPKRHILKSVSPEHQCFTPNNKCCNTITEKNQYCYQAQAIQTAKQVSKSLNLKPSQYQVTFQSRVGLNEWISPYTIERLTELAKEDIQNILIVAPAFVCDCLETLEELEIENKKNFIHHGGKSLTVIPCLNNQAHWITALYKIIKDQTDL